MTTTDKPDIEVVYLGPCALSGGKKGSLFMTPELLAQQPDFAAIWKTASPFPAARGLVIGAKYKSNGEVGEDHRVNRLGLKGLRISGRVEHPALIECELRQRAQDEKEKTERLDRKLKADSRLTREVEQLGAFLSRLPYTQAYAAEQAIVQAIREAARKAGRR